MAQPASVGSPQIVISYHVDDSKWLDRLFTHLHFAVEKFGLYEDRVGPRHSNPLDLLPESADYFLKAKVMILLVSRKYMASTWLSTARGQALMAALAGNGIPVMGVVLEEITREDLVVLHTSQFSAINVTPLTAIAMEGQNSVMFQLSREVTRVLEKTRSEQQSPLKADDLARRFEWSSEVGEAVRRARKLATSNSPRTVTTTALLFGLAEGGRQQADYFRTPHFLWTELTANGEDAYTKVLLDEFPDLINLGERAGRSIDSISLEANFITPNVQKVFELAEQIARRTVPATAVADIGARHLLAALLVLSPDDGPTGASRRLATIVGDVTALRERFYDFIVKTLPDDNHEAWRPIILDLKLPEITPPPTKQPEPEQRETPAQPTVAGFMADEWNGRDLLGIEQDVNALASLVAAYKVEPPLSIGLFGDWGSGKSHFMRQMRKRVELLSRKSRQSGKPQKELGYYKNIVQIEFNAWHYIEGNLWASLVDHIFANLKLSDKEPRKYADERRDELMQKLGVKEEIQDRINSKVQECEDELRKLNERKEQAEAELQQASTQLKGFREEVKANLKTLSIRVSFSAEEKELLSRLGVETGSAITAADVHKSYLEIKRGWNAVKAKWKLFRTDKRVLRRYLLSALLAAILIGGPALLKFASLPRLPTIVVTILGVVATLYAAARPAWEQFQKSLKALEKYDHEVERERQKRITELENEVSALTKEVVAAKLESETVGKEIAKLKADIENTSSARILAEFIEDRAGASDYRRHLGLLALIRRDFEKLRDLFEQQRREEEEGIEVDDKRKINRIVLYIDDLDRCPPERVVQVLQAIHLLLAFPLFVVVVGVDSRWITRSLRQNYEWLREVDEQLSNGEKKNGAEEPDDRSFKAGATPHDYLEKIFQIPFWLKSMNNDACIEFLNGLTKDVIEQVAAPEREPSYVAIHQPAVAPGALATIDVLEVEGAPHVVTKPEIAEYGGTTASGTQNNREATKLSVTQDEIDLAPRSLTFSAQEIEFMKQLVPLIGRSPRAVKRFLNCYRLIKVGLTPAEFESFAGKDGNPPSYQAAMILLGVITGTPAVSSYVIDHLKTWRPEGVETTVEAWANRFALDPEVRRQPDAQRLIQFFETHDFNPRPSSQLLIKEMVSYASRVSRFSFRLNQPDPFRR